MSKTQMRDNFSSTVLTRHYAPFNYKPPITIFVNLLWRYIYLQFTPPSTVHGKFIQDGRTLLLRRTRGRLELTVPPYEESSYLLASDTSTKQLATRRQACSQLVVVQKCITFSDCTYILCALIDSGYFAVQNQATTGFIASSTRRWQTFLPLLFLSHAPRRGKGHITAIISLPLLVAKSNRQKWGA